MFDIKRISIFERKTFISTILYQIDNLIKFIIKEFLNLIINNPFDFVILLRFNNKDYYKTYNRFIL